MPGPSLDIYLNFVISIQILVFLNSSIPPKTLLCTNAPNLCINCVFRIQIFVILFTPALAPTSRNYANRNINSDNDNEIWGCACQASENQGDRVPSFPAPKQSTTISNSNCQSRLTLKTAKSYISINECPLFQILILMLEWKWSMRNESFLQILGKSCHFRYNGWVLLFSESSCQFKSCCCGEAVV